MGDAGDDDADAVGVFDDLDFGVLVFAFVFEFMDRAPPLEGGVVEGVCVVCFDDDDERPAVVPCGVVGAERVTVPARVVVMLEEEEEDGADGRDTGE